MQKDMKDTIRRAQDRGWIVEHGRKTMKLRHPHGDLVCCSRTPSCPFAHKHLEGDLRRVEKKYGQS